MLIAQAVVPAVEVYAGPDRDTADPPLQVLGNPTPNGGPLVFLINAARVDEELVPVYLPVRPNGSIGYVPLEQVRISRTGYRLQVELGAHRLTVTEDGEPVIDTPIGVGTRDAPTPNGLYYITELLRPPDPDTIYGPFAYGLSGFSNELESFAGGEGVIGIHGTNDPTSIGRDVSHGCIRVPNPVITRMTELLPLGTPVEIHP